MVKVAVINKNRCEFKDLGNYATDILYTPHIQEKSREIRKNIDNYIWNVISDYIEFVDVELTDIMEYACRKLTEDFPDKAVDSDFFYYTELSYSFPKKFIEFIHCLPAWKSYDLSKAENMNNICCLMSLKHNVIENKCVVLASTYDTSLSEKVRIDSIDKSDIIRIVRRRFFFTSVLICENNLQKYYFQDISILIKKIFNLGDNDDIETFKFNFLEYNLIMYFQINKSKYVNKIATRINGSHYIYGDVIIVHQLEDNVFANLSIHEVKRLNVLGYGRLYDRELLSNEIDKVNQDYIDDNGEVMTKKITPIKSRYAIINNRMKKWNINKNICINCSEIIKKPVICDKCYRMKYCSKECKQQYYSKYHHNECLN